MSGVPSTQTRQRARIPSGPRPPPLAPSRLSSTSSVPTTKTITAKTSLASLVTRDSPLDALIDNEHDFTFSPEGSPELRDTVTEAAATYPAPISDPSNRGRTLAFTSPEKRDDSKSRAATAPLFKHIPRPHTPNASSFFVSSRPSTPVGSPPPGKAAKPKVSRLNTNLPVPTASPTRPVSPGLKHWQQVRQHVLAPSPIADDRSSTHRDRGPKKPGLMGRLGFRNAAEQVMGYQGDHHRRSTMGLGDLGGLSEAEREDIARERRKFARDVKTCLDACALEESRRRLLRSGQQKQQQQSRQPSEPKSVATSVHTSSHQRYTFDPDFSAFAPLLTELHKHLPAARAKRSHSRTCPHHAAILAELGVNFLPDGASTDGERQQALEVFGVVVRNWASDSASEELERWIWLCRALRIDDRALRNRGLTLLVSFLHADPALPRGHDRPRSALAFQALASALLGLLQSVEASTYPAEEHVRAVNTFLADLMSGDILEVEVGSLEEVLGDAEVDMTVGAGGAVERDLLWMAVGRELQDELLAHWLLASDGSVIKRFMPPPLLHATPPVILHLRALSTCTHLSSLSALVRASHPPDAARINQIWQTASSIILPELDSIVIDAGVSQQLGSFLLAIELARHHALTLKRNADSDPFRISMNGSAPSLPTEHRTALERYIADGRYQSGILAAAQDVTANGPFVPISSLLREFLASPPLFPLARDCILGSLFHRIDPATSPLGPVRSLLLHLQTHHPQILYKPLFSLSAATQLNTLSPHLRTVRALADAIGIEQYWLGADPQMAAIVLLGDVAPKANKGKAREGERRVANIKLGRYAVAMEMIRAFDGDRAIGGEDVQNGDRIPKAKVKAFADGVEARLGPMLEAEEKDKSLPGWYRSLICRLLLAMRLRTMSLRRASWMKIVVAWLLDSSSPSQLDEGPASALWQAYHPAQDFSANPSSTRIPLHKASTVHSMNLPSAPVHPAKDPIYELGLEDAAAGLAVAVHACLNTEEWEELLPFLWDQTKNLPGGSIAIIFLLMKCAEMLPSRLHDLILSDVTAVATPQRLAALRALSQVYLARHNILAQPILTTRRGPVFAFPARTLEFVTTEIGSAHWLPPHDVQDAALKKFGSALPLELRQRLLELGWSEDEGISGRADWEKIPVSSLPSLEGQESDAKEAGSPHLARTELVRHGSSGSAGSLGGGKRKKPIFAPVLLGLVAEQAVLLAVHVDGGVASVSAELVRLLQRDDPTLFIRPFTDAMADNYPLALAKLNAVIFRTTPGFAYYALNTLTGYLKHVLRTDPAFAGYAASLATIARLVPGVSEMSLRDIRKNKAESILLPASIHEDEGGFKLHQPWQEASFDVQTAQLSLLTEILKVNPREVYLVKKMLSNLQISSSIHHRPFARAWLILIVTLFSTVNRNYNDRAELRHFLSNVALILRRHGAGDTMVAAHAMRVFTLCSARFRRLFASMAFTTIMRPVYEVYARGHGAVRDCIEYACRSFYRIHGESFVYATCAVIADSEHEVDPKAVYDLLCSLSSGNTASSGVSSGIRGLNDKEEIETLVQMISGPELSLSEIGTAAAERQAHKLANLTLEDKLFPRENIVRLFVTVIAANPATARAASFLRLFAGIIPFIKDQLSQDLLREAIEALGMNIIKGKVGDEAAVLAFNPNDVGSEKLDWVRARSEYVLLVESFARSGGRLGASATRRTLEIVLDLLKTRPEAVGPAASSILGKLATTHLATPRPGPLHFLRDIAPIFRLFIAVVDFSGVLESIHALITQNAYDLDAETTRVIVESYVEPAIRLLATASEENMSFILPLRSSAVKLLSAAVFLTGGDALGPLERHAPNASLLASIVLPLSLLLEAPPDIDRDAINSALWIRLLHYVLRPPIQRQAKAPPAPQALAATAVLSLQIIKIIILRAADAISQTQGLWAYISASLMGMLASANGLFVEGLTQARRPSSPGAGPSSPRVVDWMAWSLYELLSLHRSPLVIHLRYQLQSAISSVHNGMVRSRPSTPGEQPRRPSTSPQLVGGRARISSARSPSGFTHSRMPSQPRVPSPDLRLTPDAPGGHSRLPSQHLSPLMASLGHGRMPSGSMSTSAGHHRPSFADLSARRASRPAFAPFPGGPAMRFRFPSSAPVRSLAPNEKGVGGGGAIIHLLGAPNQVLSATSSGFPTLSPGVGGLRGDGGKGDAMSLAVREIRLESEGLSEGAKRAVKTCLMVFGYPVEQYEEEWDSVRVWSTHDALHIIAEQTRMFVEEEFANVFNPTNEDWTTMKDRIDITSESFDLDRSLDEKRDEGVEDMEELKIPRFAIS